ncbi:hypothetical protein KZ813_05985 [Sphingomonas sp. RHCKR7]|uniref:hypothetical protein n=1 Tax=Sphingomonas folli TaxID=2862497 RepID=UPI001CA599C8|nr:hypothetical protein [Sphingomonas folli]MBW6526384.1 hypothetical protein [Sphingomonas folli]
MIMSSEAPAQPDERAPVIRVGQDHVDQRRVRDDAGKRDRRLVSQPAARSFAHAGRAIDPAMPFDPDAAGERALMLAA